MSLSPCYFKSHNSGAAEGLRLELTPTCFYLLSYHHLDMAKFESDKGSDTLTISFLNRTVHISGKNLRELAIDIQRRNVESIKPMPERYGSIGSGDAWVKTIEIEGKKEQD